MQSYINGKYLLLGTNLGERAINLKEAIDHLTNIGIVVIEKSSIYESEPWGIADQPWFLNQVVKIETELSPEQLLNEILNIEEQMGRIRKIKWGERLIDIDILFYNDSIITKKEPSLIIPHPEIQNRKFTLDPLAELISEQIHPKLGKTIQELKQNCGDPLTCRKISGN